MKENLNQLLEKLIEGDEIPEMDFGATTGQYTHRKEMSNIGGNSLEWVLLSKAIHTWWQFGDKAYVQNLIKIEGDGIICYRPSVIKDFLANNSAT